MKTINVETLMAAQQNQRDQVIKNYRGESAFALACLALEHDSGSAYAAASLLLAMENGKQFDFKCLLQFDIENRAHADLVMLGYKPHQLWPSIWMNELGYPGTNIMSTLRLKWE